MNLNWFKIRSIIFIFLALFCLFVIGFVRNALAADISFAISYMVEPMIWIHGSSSNQVTEMWWDGVNFTYENLSGITDNYWPYDGVSLAGVPQLWACDDQVGWQFVHHGYVDYSSFPSTVVNVQWTGDPSLIQYFDHMQGDPISLGLTCGAIPCQAEADALTVACSGASNVAFFDPELCEGYCVDCTTITQSAIDQCESQSQTLPEGWNCTATLGDLSNYSQVPIALSIDPTNCADPDSCNQAFNLCYAQCNGNISDFACTDQGGPPNITVPCTCDGTIASPSPDPTGEHGTPDTTDNPSQPADTDSDLLGKIADNTNNINKNDSLTANILDNELNELNSNVDQTNQHLKSANDKLSEIESDLDDIKSGTFNAPNFGTAYSPDPDEFSDISEFQNRFDTFVTDMKNTPLFSLPNDLIANIPTSSDSIITIDTGSYGIHNIDLNDYSSTWNVLKTIIMIGTSVVCIRIITLKG